MNGPIVVVPQHRTTAVDARGHTRIGATGNTPGYRCLWNVIGRSRHGLSSPIREQSLVGRDTHVPSDQVTVWHVSREAMDRRVRAGDRLTSSRRF
ncbi:hypothetical protein Cme02nite_70240 [Catellatospora methionotrophica]|uniref:Uncharacterized protein n=1 Tax=Catellatospora methionotrophica TaxID=121620 RepID=A0A8J3PIR7_9ACTN|nr:hypothetical protein Cme02nite_70240 [Catellatospora methionotrophica]